MHEEGPPRCLKSWSPHKESPLSCLLWLDDHTNSNPDTSFWKFVVTGSEHNSELKVWCSSSWTCLQTLRFQRPSADTATPLRLKAVLDPTARFLVLSDIDSMLVYVLNIQQTEDRAEVVSVAEFASPASIMSLSCVSAGLRTVEQTTEGLEVSIDTDNLEAGDRRLEKTVVQLYFVQPKSLQECSIIYDNAASAPSLSVSISEAAGDLKPLQPSPKSPAAAPELSSSPRSQLPPLPSMPGLAEAASKISLLSPDQFQSPVSAPAAPVAVKQEPIFKQEPTFSGNSSPSREVAGILDDCVTYNEEVENENDANDEEDEEDDVEEEEEERTFRDIKATPTSHNTSIKFPTPPAPPALTQAAATTPTGAGAGAGSAAPQVDMRKMEELLEAATERTMERTMKMMEKKFEAKAKKDNEVLLHRIDDLFMKLSSNVNRKIEDTIGAEVKRTLPALVKKSFDGLEKDINQKLSGLDTRVAKELTSGQSRDLIGRAVASNISDVVETSYKHAFANQVTGMERAFGAMFKQINDQFLAGTREYEAALHRRMETENIEIKEMVNPVVTSVQGINTEMRHLREVVEKVKNDQANLAKQVAGKKNVTGEEIRKIVHKEVNEALSASRNGSVKTPQPDVKTVSTMQTIKSLIQAGKFNDAFLAALSSSDLQMVMFTCENVNTTQVFNQSTCPLSQQVLLSLIQQLSVDISDKTEVKYSYIQEALANLDPENPTTKMHLKLVLKQLEASLHKYIQENPNSKMTRNLKILSMAATSHLQLS